MNLHINDIVLFGGIGAVVAIAYILLAGGSSFQSRMKKRAAKLGERKVSKPKTAQDAMSLRRKSNEPTSKFLTALMKPLPNVEMLGNRLQRAGSTMNPKQFMLRCLLGVLLSAFLFKIMGKPILLGFFIGIVVCAWLPLQVLKYKINKQQKAFLQLFPEGIDLIVRGLRSGLPVSDSIVLVSTEVAEPVAGVFMHVANTMHLGVSLEKSLQEVAKKLNYTEFNFFVTSIILQRETGGNLSEILGNLSDVLRARYMMKMKIKAMTSEARASAMIIGALPFLVMGAVSALSPDYIKPLFTTAGGNKALASAAGMLFGGIWTMNRMAKFEI